MTLQEIGAAIAESRKSCKRLLKYPSPMPKSLEDAYIVQEHMARAMGEPVVGWKVGFTSATARKAAGVSEPLAGPLFQETILGNGATVDVNVDDLKIVEAEIGFRLKGDLPPSKAPYTREAVVAAIGTVHPIFEIVNKRLPGDVKETPEWLVADGSINQAVVVGDGSAFDAKKPLTAETVVLSANDKPISEGIGANAMDDPVTVLVWLANHLSARGIPLKTGELVATGLLCDLVFGEVGITYCADFQSLGTVTMAFANTSAS
ncbi:2-keto-4-pentenoate hydratase [Aliiroseovarius crassostreae]|uniref:2-keto-4-pentenoate hydratase n=1 Tax=Aliiroseovarius crassostreae TaxID=154981 RepID=UPI003C7DA9CA